MIFNSMCKELNTLRPTQQYALHAHYSVPHLQRLRIARLAPAVAANSDLSAAECMATFSAVLPTARLSMTNGLRHSLATASGRGPSLGLRPDPHACKRGEVSTAGGTLSPPGKNYARLILH